MKWSRTLLVVAICFGCQKTVKHQVPENTYQSFTNIDEAKQSYQNELNFWAKFQDKTLSYLIQEALLNNLDLKIARANIMLSRAIKKEASSVLYPELNLDGTASRDRLSTNLPFTTFSTTSSKFISDFFSLGFDAIWELDLFGANKTKVKAKKALIRTSEYELKDVALTLFAEVASTYVEIRSIQYQILVNEQRQMLIAQLLTLKKDLVQAGLEDEINLLAEKERLLQQSAELEEFRKNLKELAHALSILIGKNPTELYGVLGKYQKIPDGFFPIEIASPSKVLQSRPDVRAREKKLESLTYDVNASVKELFPKFSIFANAGRQADSLHDFVSAKSTFWGFGIDFFYNILTQKGKRAVIKQNKALREVALLEYKKTVLDAFKEVEDGLSNYFLERKRFITFSLRQTTSEKKAHLFNERFLGGQISFIEVLDAKLETLTQKKEQIESKKLVAIYLIALYKSFGGPFNAI